MSIIQIINLMIVFVICTYVPFIFFCIQNAETLNAAFLPLRSESTFQNFVLSTLIGLSAGQGGYCVVTVIQTLLLSVATFDEIFLLLR